MFSSSMKCSEKRVWCQLFIATIIAAIKDSDVEELSEPPTPAASSPPAQVSPSPPPTPPLPPSIQAAQLHLQSHQRWCAELLESSTNEQAVVREQLAQARQRREAALFKLRVAKCLRSAAAVLNNKYQRELLEVRDSCRQILREIEKERRWRPASVTMSQRHQRELIQRVASLKSLLAATSRSRHALPFDGHLGNSSWT